jgi:hypothetical protein
MNKETIYGLTAPKGEIVNDHMAMSIKFRLTKSRMILKKIIIGNVKLTNFSLLQTSLCLTL